ncbi:DUF2798 domain-containing protein [Halarchaeum nitratireducens]|uniref:DUF2798 domain-containing protein n=1 Tax=Halarchaeum nitratireducens TaxID=489913 RepID=A0A830GD57_9EURY|nr:MULTISPECIES: DUF2798 domain-containing protein [Halarchaeum]MBP2251076.1 hypothetical protein [Halarchaeum solikamskense]GGN22062.1 hypothetical protein GCM10009021_24370 [Halarchaeum nitratireducens]
MNRNEMLGEVVFSGIMSFFIGMVASTVLVIVFSGLGPGFVMRWLTSVVLAFIIAWPTAVVCTPLAVRIQNRLPVPNNQAVS